MLLEVEVGQRVQAWYGKQSRAQMPMHGQLGTVVIPCRGKPRNHGVLFDGEDVLRAMPCGNLREPRDEPQLELF